MNRQPPTVVLYARRSSDTEDRQTLSIPSQTAELHKLAVMRSIEIADELTESAAAREPGRPVFGELMRRVMAERVTGTWSGDWTGSLGIRSTAAPSSMSTAGESHADELPVAM